MSRTPMPTPSTAAPGRPRLPGGFTVIELMVAILLASAAIALASYLFDTTRRATRLGLERSTVYQTALQAETRLRMDMKLTTGPLRTADREAGAIVVIPGMRQGTLPVIGQKTEQAVTQLRSDQLVMFYDAKNGGLIRGASGTGPKIKSLTVSGVRSEQAKIWVGHVRQAAPVGEPVSAIQWILGRQATLLVDPDTTVVNTPVTLDTTTTLSPASTASLAGDVAPWGLAEVANWMRAAGRTDNEMVTAFAVAPNSVGNYTNQPQVQGQPLLDRRLDTPDIFSGYRVFMTNCSEFIVQYTMDANYNGMIDTNGVNDYSGEIKWYPDDRDVFDASRAGHAAAILPKVFYPGDDQVRVWHLGYYQGPDPTQYYTNMRGDRTPYPPLTDPAGLPSGVYHFGDGIAPGDYGGPTASGDPNADPPDFASNPLYARVDYDNAMSAYASHHNGYRPAATLPPRQSLWPQLVRIRYRLHDEHGQIYTYMDEFNANRRDDDGRNGIDDKAEKRMSGVWFEHVFSMPYPRTN